MMLLYKQFFMLHSKNQFYRSKPKSYSPPPFLLCNWPPNMQPGPPMHCSQLWALLMVHPGRLSGWPFWHGGRAHLTCPSAAPLANAPPHRVGPLGATAHWGPGCKPRLRGGHQPGCGPQALQFKGGGLGAKQQGGVAKPVGRLSIMD